MKNFLLVLCAGVVLTSCGPVDSTEDKPRPPLVALMDAPEFDLENIRGGRVKSSDFEGKVLLVDFWATWCAPCKIEIPEYNKMVEQRKDQDVQFIGIAFESGSPEDITPFADEFAMNYPVVMGTDDVDSGFGGYIGLPTTFLVGRDGKIYRKFIGTTPSKMRDIEKDLDSLLALDQASNGDAHGE